MYANTIPCMDTMPAMTLVFTTVDTESAAQALAQRVISQHLAACVHIECIHSLYRWQGALQNTPEFRLMAKTTPQRAGEVHNTWKAAHPYEVPAIWSVQAQVLDPAYARWLAEESQGGQAPRA